MINDESWQQQNNEAQNKAALNTTLRDLNHMSLSIAFVSLHNKLLFEWHSDFTSKKTSSIKIYIFCSAFISNIYAKESLFRINNSSLLSRFITSPSVVSNIEILMSSFWQLRTYSWHTEIGLQYFHCLIWKSSVVTALLVREKFGTIFFEIFLRKLWNDFDFAKNIEFLKRVKYVVIVFRLLSVELANWIVFDAS